MLWISQHFVLGRICPHLRCCGLRGFATVDYAPAVLWITWLRHCGLVEDVGAGFIVAPSHCGGKE